MKFKAIVTSALIFVAAATAQAIPYGFTVVADTNSLLSDVTSQLSVDVTQNSTKTFFKFTNTGNVASNISEIYFDWAMSPGLVYSGMTYTGVVKYILNSTNPANLPGGNTIAFLSDWSTEPKNPEPRYGIANYNGTGTADSLTIAFTGLLGTLSNDNLRIGLHVTGLPYGASESYVTGGNAPSVPEPGTFVLLGAGLLGLGIYGRKRSSK